MSEERGPSKWYILWDKDRNGETRARIRRNVGEGASRKLESLPYKQYRHIKKVAEIEQFVEQLNHRHKSAQERAREAYKFSHVFISQEILDKFRDDLVSDAPSRYHGQTLYLALERDGLHWFISKLGLPDPINWKRHEKQWGHALKSELDQIKGLGKTDRLEIFKDMVHPDTIKKRVQVMNRFLKYLHGLMPETVPPIILEPISKASMTKYKADYVQNEDYEPGQYIEDDHWKIIEQKMDPKILPYAQIGYYFGLRKSECLGLQHDDLYEDCIKVERQLISIQDKPKYGPVKSRKPRNTPYWFMTPDDLYSIIPKEEEKITSSWYGELFSREMKRLELPYGTHDLRRTFITKCFRENKNARDIMLAVGHRDLNTTMRYAMDDRGLGQKKKFVPKKSG